MSMPTLGENARYPGYIAWCEKRKEGYRIGVALIDEQTLFGARMGEQVCQIEHFSRLQQQQSPCPQDLQALALEWVTHHAVEFSQATMDHAMAQAVLDAVKSDEHKAELAGAKAQLTFLSQAKDLPDVADLKTRVAQNPQDDEAAYHLAVQQLARQQYEGALEGLLKLFIRNRSYSEGLPHKTLLQVFELLGNDHPLVTVYRRKLFAALY